MLRELYPQHFAFVTLGFATGLRPSSLRPLDLARAAEVKDVVTRAISGHATEQMQQHYSTVNAAEVEASIGKVISLARARDALARQVAIPKWEAEGVVKEETGGR